MQVTYSKAANMLTACIKAKLVPMLAGSPGIGKSGIVRQIAKEYGLKVIDLRLSQCDPTDLLGMPSVEGNRAGYFPMNTFPIEGDAIPAGYNGWLLFLDEFTSAARAVQAAAYKLVLDRMVGMFNLHKNVAIVCAGNTETDNAIVEPMSTALQSRLIHLELTLDYKEWLNWFYEFDGDHRISDFIKFKPQSLYTFQPDHTDKTYACPRTWEFASRLLSVTDDDDPERLPLLAGTLSEGVAREFITFCKIYDTLPKMSKIQADPLGTPVPQEPSVLYALTGSIAQNAEKENADSLMTYLGRLPLEFQIVSVREIVRRKKELLAHPALQKWVDNTRVTLF
jgi:hypothetical protein